MPSEQRKSITSAAYQKFRRTHGRLSRRLIIALIALVLGFDFLCVFAEEFMGAPLIDGSVISIGIAIALLIILLILTAALYYVRRINTAYLDMHMSPDED